MYVRMYVYASDTLHKIDKKKIEMDRVVACPVSKHEVLT